VTLQQNMSRKPPTASALAATTLTVLTVVDRVPDPREQPSPSVQAPARRHDEQDETQHETDTERMVTQGQEQAPPPAAAQMPAGRGLQWDWSSYERDQWQGWRAAHDATQRNAALLDLLIRSAASKASAPELEA
jgi:hypothetical protein